MRNAGFRLRSVWRGRARLARYAPLLGLVLVNGCLARLENNVDLVLSPGAVDNALVLPYSGLADLAQLIAKLWHG